MNHKLYPGNLSYNTDGEQLWSLFAKVGLVDSVTVSIDRELEPSKVLDLWRWKPKRQSIA